MKQGIHNLAVSNETGFPTFLCNWIELLKLKQISQTIVFTDL